MIQIKAPFRADVVGSFLRPAAIKEARAKFSKGEISYEELTKVEDLCIINLVRKQKSAGLKTITDGEFRRSYWHLDFMWGFKGVDQIELNHGYSFKHEETTHGSLKLSDKISGENHPFVKHFKFLKQLETDGLVARQTMPSPAQFYAELFREDNGKVTRSIYPNHEELVHDIAAAYRSVIKDLYDIGCRNIQFDDCTWGMVVDTNFWKTMTGGDFESIKLQETYLLLNNLALEGRPSDLVATTHVCRGNYHSTWAAEGSYNSISKFLFARENVDAFYLEYDDARSGGFEPLADIPDNKKVVLGLITTKSPVLEDKQTIINRIHEASKYVKLDNLCLSPQCGFASCEIGNKLTEEEQWRKIALVTELALEVWG